MSAYRVSTIQQGMEVCRVFSNGFHMNFAMITATTKAGVLRSASCPLSSKVPGPTILTDVAHETKGQTMADRVHMEKADMQGLL